MEDYAKIVGANIRNLRNAYRMSQEDLGKKLILEAANISRWERGMTVPRGDYLPEISEVFHVSIDSLFGIDRATDRIMELQRENGILRQQIEQLHEAKSELDAMRNELCYKCGKYREAHNGACDGCRWKEAALKGGED